MHAGPAVAAVADIGRDALLARQIDQMRDEAVIALAMGRRREAHGGRAHAARRDGRGRRLGGAREIGGGLVRLGRDAARRESQGPRSPACGRSEPSSARRSPRWRACRPRNSAANREKSWLKAVWMTASACGRAVAQAFQIFERAAMDLGAGGGERLGAGVRSGRGRAPVARGDQFADDGGADKAGRAGDEYAHVKSPCCSETHIGRCALYHGKVVTLSWYNG